MTKEEFLRYDQEARDIIEVRRIYIWMAGDFKTGLLLSQILYWHGLARETRESRSIVNRKGRTWLVKSADDWFYETGITRRELTTALSKLIKLGIIDKAVMKFNGVPTNHIAVNWSILQQEAEKARLRENRQ